MYGPNTNIALATKLYMRQRWSAIEKHLEKRFSPMPVSIEKAPRKLQTACYAEF